MGNLFSFSKSGGGKGKSNNNKSKKQIQVTNLYNILLSIGFRKSLLSIPTNNARINDPLFQENYSNEDAIKELWRYWSPTITSFRNDSTSKRALQAVGFKYTEARALAKILDPIWNTFHYSVETIIDLAIEYKLGKFSAHAPFIKHGFLFSLNDSNKNGVVKNDIHPTVLHFNGCISKNESENENLKTITRYLDTFAIDGIKLYFHATNWSGALSIMKEGVVHQAGRKCLDFGINPGFYSSPDVKDALEWAHKRRSLFNNECAILVFALPRVFLSATNASNASDPLSIKQFAKPNREWTKLTLESRACVLKYNELDAYDFVHGPIMADIYRGIPHKPIKYQLASKSTKADAVMNKHLVGVVWLRK